MFSLYRSAREVIGIYQDLRQLYEMAAEAYARREPAPYEVELISDFRNCCSCAYDADPLVESEAEPFDTGWSVVGQCEQKAECSGTQP